MTPFLNPPVTFMREAIESVLAQTFDRWELFLVDDGSRGDSVELALKYARQYPDRIHYLQHEDHGTRGISASRNLAVRRAQGEYIGVLDADDLWLPHKLEQQIAILQRFPEVGSVYGRTRYWFSWSGPEDQSLDHVPELRVPLDSVLQPPGFLARMITGAATVPCTCSLLVRRELMEVSGGFDEAFTGMFEDQVFYTKIFLRSPVYASSQCWDYYRRHSESLCATTSPVDGIAARRRFLHWVRTYLLQTGIDEGPVLQSVLQGFWELDHPWGARILRSGRRALRMGGRMTDWLAAPGR